MCRNNQDLVDSIHHAATKGHRKIIKDDVIGMMKKFVEGKAKEAREIYKKRDGKDLDNINCDDVFAICVDEDWISEEEIHEFFDGINTTDVKIYYEYRQANSKSEQDSSSNEKG